MNAVSSILARALVAVIFGPIDRAVCRWTELTDSDTH